MKKKESPAFLPDDVGAYYEIKVKGHLKEHWSDWLGGLEITREGDDSLLTGTVPDQAALHGILVQIRDLGLTLISITPKNVPDEEQEKVAEMLDEFTNTFQYAGFGKRLKAFAFDYLFIFAYIVALAGVNYGIILSGGALEDISPFLASPIIKDAIAFLTLILPIILYFTLQESSPKQATWGKRKVGLRVVNASGEALTRLQALVRSLVKFLPWQIAHTSLYHIEGLPFAPVEPSSTVMVGFALVYLLVGIYVASALISKKHRTPYDWVAGSYVIVAK
jgi:uncharacterized RDD family membrane protein YckC